MGGRHLDPEERALWRQVIETVRPIGRSARTPKMPADKAVPAEPPPMQIAEPARRIGRVPPPRAPRMMARPVAAVDTLDGGWDRRLRRGLVGPDRVVDLHGHTLATAHAALEAELARALSVDARMILLVTGRPPRDRGDDGAPRRGLIRAAVGDWLAGSAYASRIAAVRNAHPRHGGAGALYVILRRRRETA